MIFIPAAKTYHHFQQHKLEANSLQFFFSPSQLVTRIPCDSKSCRCVAWDDMSQLWHHNLHGQPRCNRIQSECLAWCDYHVARETIAMVMSIVWKSKSWPIELQNSYQPDDAQCFGLLQVCSTLLCYHVKLMCKYGFNLDSQSARIISSAFFQFFFLHVGVFTAAIHLMVPPHILI